jgi:1-acyl-sn-glycerol-3-phosphate acyltransferase
MKEVLRIQTHKWFNNLVKATVGFYLFAKYDLHAENKRILKEIPKPYVLLPTHSSLFDPFFHNFYVPYPMYIVTSDSLFRNKFTSFWIRQFGCIPKSQSIPDIETIRNIHKVINRGDILCMYPEGMQTWDGASLPVIPGTARLLKMLKVPVIRVFSHGAFSTSPRWSANRRQGRVTLSFKEILTKEQITSLKISEIQSILDTEFNYNEWEWLKNSRRRFNNFFGAQRIYRLLYCCPQCKKLNSIRGAGNIIYCNHCKLAARYTNKGSLVPAFFSCSNKVPENLHEWNCIQKLLLEEKCKRKITAITQTEGKKSLILRNNAVLSTGYRMDPMKKQGRGSLQLYSDILLFVHEDDTTAILKFELTTITGISFMKRYIEFYYHKVLYRFHLLSKYSSTLEWNDAIAIIRSWDSFLAY